MVSDFWTPVHWPRASSSVVLLLACEVVSEEMYHSHSGHVSHLLHFLPCLCIYTTIYAIVVDDNDDDWQLIPVQKTYNFTLSSSSKITQTIEQNKTMKYNQTAFILSAQKQAIDLVTCLQNSYIWIISNGESFMHKCAVITTTTIIINGIISEYL